MPPQKKTAQMMDPALGEGKWGDPLPLISISGKDLDSDWSADDRRHHKLEQCQEEILAGNYDLDNHPPTLSHHSSLTSSESNKGSHASKVHRQMRGGHIPDPDNEDEGRGAEVYPQGHKPGWPPLEAIHQAQALETMKDYHTCQMQHYEEHKDEENHDQLWVEIHESWKEGLTGAKDISSKAMVGQVMTCKDAFTQAAQMWCNVKGIHVLGCVIYSSNDDAACQAQGIFAGSQLCMQLASKRQTDVARLIDYLATIVKYKALDSVAEVPLPNFPSMSCPSLWPVLFALITCFFCATEDQQWCGASDCIRQFIVIHRCTNFCMVATMMVTKRSLADDPFSFQLWPLTNERHRAELLALRSSHRMRPLPTYDLDNDLLLPSTYQRYLQGAIVEIHFTLTHWSIASAKWDIYGGLIQLVYILVPAVPSSAAGTKRKLPLHLEIEESPTKKSVRS
ncbi:hypothetical protein BKA83DRAFT_4546287 [Pisolithus microcarpus]|nr:hypothetical protein BKA83DRAFT_4546287 [Pisolithus microcarpus]